MDYQVKEMSSDVKDIVNDLNETNSKEDSDDVNLIMIIKTK